MPPSLVHVICFQAGTAKNGFGQGFDHDKPDICFLHKCMVQPAFVKINLFEILNINAVEKKWSLTQRLRYRLKHRT